MDHEWGADCLWGPSMGMEGVGQARPPHLPVQAPLFVNCLGSHRPCGAPEVILGPQRLHVLVLQRAESLFSNLGDVSHCGSNTHLDRSGTPYSFGKGAESEICHQLIPVGQSTREVLS